jgi:hypothetical protein
VNFRVVLKGTVETEENISHFLIEGTGLMKAGVGEV